MKLLLLVQNESDVAHLDGAAKAILNSAITGVWCVFSPSITVNASEAAAKLDGEITQLRTAERAAADRGDYTAAAGYKTQREGKELDKGKALRDAWKVAPEEDRKAKTKEIFGPFTAQLQAKGLNVRVTGHSDHYEREQWVAMLNSLSGVWFKPFEPGSFVVGWPESVKDSLPQRGMVQEIAGREVVRLTEKMTLASAAESIAKINPQDEPTRRRAELTAMHPMKLGPLMRGLGLDGEGMSRSQKIDAILAAESGATAPALAEY